MKKYRLFLAALVCLPVLSAWAGQWTYNSESAKLSHDTSGWVLAVSRNGTNLTVTSVSQSPGTPSALPLSDPMPGYALVSIGYAAFNACTRLTSVTIPASVTTIGNYAFFSCSALTSVTIPASVTSIGDYAFTYCYSLASVTIPASVASIGNYAFYYCSGLTSVTIPDSVASIGDYAFWHCTGLTSVTIPASVTSIGSYAFEYCALTSITIPNGVTSIGNSAFSYCALTSVTIPSSVTNIGYRAFIGAQIGRSLASITVHPDNPYYASVDGVLFDKELTVLIQCPAGFSGAVTVPSSVTSIGDHAFSSCNSLSSILFMGAPPVLGTSVFNGTHTVIYYRKGTPGWTDTFGGQPAAPFPFDFTLANGQITIDSYTGSGTASVQIPATIAGCPVTSIGDAAFYSQTNMTAVHIPDSVTAVGWAAFAGCTGLQTLVLSSHIAELGNWAFYGCTSLASVYMRGNAPVVGVSVFTGTPAMIYYLPGMTGWGNTFGGRPAVLLPYAYTVADGAVRIDAYLGDSATVEIPATIEGLPVTAIGDNAFENCDSLVSVTIPNSVQSIGEAAFCNCPLLSDVTLPSCELTLIGDWAFAGCESLTYIVIPAIGRIGDYAFAFCPALSEVYLNSYSVPTVGISAFDWTEATIYYPANSDNWGATFAGRPTSPMLFSFSFIGGNVTINSYLGSYTNAPNAVAIPSAIAGKPVTVIDDYAFYGCTSLASVTIGKSVTSIGDYAFFYCTALTSISVHPDNPCYASFGGVLFDKDITVLIRCPSGFSGVCAIPESVTTIGYEAFSGCSALASVTIPDSVTNIGDYTFYACTSLASVTIGNSVMTIGYEAFSRCTSLASVTIPASVASIGNYAFYGCTSLDSVTIGKSVTSIGNSVFWGCSALTSITVHPDSPYYASVDGVLFDKELTVLIQCPKGFTGVYTIPDSTTSIGNEAFYGCTSLTAVTIPDSVTSIGSWAFYGCSVLASITIPDSVTYIGHNAFRSCSALASVTIPNSVTFIADVAFYNCTALTSVTIPDSVTSIGYDAFRRCTSLASVLFTGGVPAIDPYAFNNSPATLYYLPGASGWGATVAGRPAVCWNPAFSPVSPPRFTSGTFGFTLTGNPNLPVKVEAATDLSSGEWTPVTSATLSSSGSLAVTDPAAAALPTRFYRIVWP